MGGCFGKCFGSGGEVTAPDVLVCPTVAEEISEILAPWLILIATYKNCEVDAAPSAKKAEFL